MAEEDLESYGKGWTITSRHVAQRRSGTLANGKTYTQDREGFILEQEFLSQFVHSDDITEEIAFALSTVNESEGSVIVGDPEVSQIGGTCFYNVSVSFACYIKTKEIVDKIRENEDWLGQNEDEEAEV